MDWYWDLLVWMAEHPLLSFLILLAEFIIIFKID